MTERSELYAIEEELAIRAEGPSCTPSQMARDILGIKDVKSLVVVDLASGTSPMVAELLDEGVNAHGVDIVYGKSIEDITRSARILLFDQVYNAPYDYREKMQEFGNAAIERFLASMQTHSAHYHEGYLTRLPFPDNFADITTSLNGITALSENVDLTMVRIKEALRITKPGGKLIMAPLHTPYDENFDYFADQHAEVIERLKSEGYQVEIESDIEVPSELLLPEFTRITIIKPS